MKTPLVLYPLAAFLFLSMAIPLSAAEKTSPVTDVVKLVKAKLSEEVLLAWVDSLSECPEIGTEKIIVLKSQKIPEKIIAALIRKSADLNKKSKPVPTNYSIPAVPKAKESRSATTKELKAIQPYSREEAVTYTYRTPVNVSYAQTPSYVYYRSSPTCYTYPNYSYYRSTPYYSSSYSSSYPSFSLGLSFGSRYYHNRGSHHYGHSYRHYGHSGNYGHRGHSGHRGGHHNHRSRTRF